MKRALYIALMLVICGLPAQTSAQQGKAQGQGQKATQAEGRKQNRAKPSQQKPVRNDAKPQARGATQQKIERGRSSSAQVAKNKAPVERRIVTRDVDRAELRTVSRSRDGLSARERAAISDAFVVTSFGDRVRVKNRSGRVLLDMDERRARNIGYWDVRPLDDEVRSNAPAFCRSGAGHPVWGRQWCIDKGFGLARYRDVRWGRATGIGDIILGRRYDSGNLLGDVLLNVIGAAAYDRLALHAISLGYTEPLTGMWIGEPNGPRVLQLYSAGYPVAEIVDADRDDHADALVVALRL